MMLSPTERHVFGEPIVFRDSQCKIGRVASPGQGIGRGLPNDTRCEPGGLVSWSPRARRSGERAQAGAQPPALRSSLRCLTVTMLDAPTGTSATRVAIPGARAGRCDALVVIVIAELFFTTRGSTQ